MHRSTTSSSQYGGGLFKGSNFFGTGRRSSADRGAKENDRVVTTPPESAPILARKPSFGGRLNPTTITSPGKRRPSVQHSQNSTEEVTAATSSPRKSGESGRKTRQGSVPQASGHPRRDSYTTVLPFANMLVRPGTSYSNMGVAGGGPGVVPNQLPSPTLENITYLHIQETSTKRISTLDYLRKAHEGRVYWFNTLLFNKPDLQRMPYFEPRKLARRATNYLLLGLSLPTVLDLNSSNATEFLKTLNALLTEFESYQSIHPPDGASSLSRARFPQMFKRATISAGKGRRTSSAADIGLPMGNDSMDKLSSGNGSGSTNSATSFTLGDTADLLPGEEYVHLLTPSLPFDPDFYETFATLCDVLIDCYTKLMSLVSSPQHCSPYIAELFTKADARVRKIIVQGVVKEFEESSRAGVKGELAGVGKVVLGGLM